MRGRGKRSPEDGQRQNDATDDCHDHDARVAPIGTKSIYCLCIHHRTDKEYAELRTDHKRDLEEKQRWPI